MNTFIKITLILALVSFSTQLSCINKNGQEIDFFTLLKYPGKVQTTNFYGYYTSDMTASNFVLGQKAMDQEGELIFEQFTAINSVSGAQVIAWNDEAPLTNGGTSISGGAHAKGLIAFDPATNTGLYIAHSIPKYPGVQSNGEIEITLPDGQNIYGQSFICLTMDGDNLEKLASGLVITEPYVYFTNFKSSKYPNLQKLAANTKGSTTQSLVLNYYAGSTPFTGFFKNPDNQIDIFEDLMSQTLKTSLLTETWGRPYRVSECTNSFQVQNIKQIKFSDSDYWNSTNDHSKYCFSSTTDDVCVGGMNHMTSQQKRGGSFQCFKSDKIQKAFNAIVGQVESCTATAKFLSQ